MFRRIYLDNAATTPVDPRVLESLLPYLTDKFGNASSIHFFGQEARAAVDKARHRVADLIGASNNEIVFTSGGTESDNLAIKGLVQSNSRHGKHLITTLIEHPAVGAVFEDLESDGYEVTRLGVDGNGRISIDELKDELRDDTILISVMAANNEIGSVQPVYEIGEIIRELRSAGRKIWFHTDAVQAVGKIPTNVDEIGCDLLSISGHKLYAPKGIGALYVRKGVRLAAQSLGGHQERSRRGGTENVALIVGLGTACEIAAEEGARNAEQILRLRENLESGVKERVPEIAVNGEKGERLPNISNISFAGIEGEAVLINLDMAGIAVSTGSACSSGSIEPSHVIVALGTDEGLARGAVRFSFGRENKMKDVERVLEVLPGAVRNLRELSPRFRTVPGA